jgi:hypothetical protein
MPGITNPRGISDYDRPHPGKKRGVRQIGLDGAFMHIPMQFQLSSCAYHPGPTTLLVSKLAVSSIIIVVKGGRGGRGGRGRG